MLEKDKAIVNMAYSAYKKGEDLNEVIAKNIKEDIPEDRVRNICVLTNHMIHSKNKKTKKQANAFSIARPDVIMEKISKCKKKSGSKKSNVKQYNGKYKTTKKQSNISNFLSSGVSFRDVVDSHRKVASAHNELRIVLANEKRHSNQLENELLNNIKKAYSSGNSMLNIEACLVSLKPENSREAVGYIKSACDSLISRGLMDSSEYEDFKSFPHKDLINKIACDPMDVEENELTNSFLLMVESFNKIARMEDDIKNTKSYLESFESIKEEILSNEEMKKKASLSSMARNSENIFNLKNLAGAVGLGVAMDIGYDASNALTDKIKSVFNTGDKSEPYLQMLQRTPSINDSEKTYEMYKTLVTSNPIYENAPHQAGMILSSLIEQNQPVSPDMIRTLVGGTKPNSKRRTGDNLMNILGEMSNAQ